MGSDVVTHCQLARSEDGSGSVLGVAIIGTVVAVLSMAVPLYIGLTVHEAVDGAVDAAALAASDVAIGIAPGSPCVAAQHVAFADGASVVACVVDGQVVTVRVQRTFLGLTMTAAATAGPPGAVTN